MLTDLFLNQCDDPHNRHVSHLKLSLLSFPLLTNLLCSPNNALILLGGGNGEQIRSYCRLDELAELEGFVTCYPDGTGPFPRRLLTWNAGASSSDDMISDQSASCSPLEPCHYFLIPSSRQVGPGG